MQVIERYIDLVVGVALTLAVIAIINIITS
jgi:hypothetical protein